MEEQDLSKFITIIDYIGQMENGVSVLLSMKVDEKIYELIYWFDNNDNYYMNVDKNFLNDYKIKSIYDYKNYKKLAFYIHNYVLKNKDEIFKEFYKN